MSIRLDPRRVGVLKRLAGETGMRPGDLVRQWVEERLDAARQGIDTPDAAKRLAAQLAELAGRVASLEAAAGLTKPAPKGRQPEVEPPTEPEAADGAVEPVSAAVEPEAAAAHHEAPEEAVDQQEPAADASPASGTAPRKRAKRVAAVPSGPRVALHDEMIAVLSEQGPMSAGELAVAVADRGRYQPPRSGKPLDAAMISQRVSNPVYRARFTRNEGRIGLAQAAE
ncbi:MAG: hypothetical protein ACXWWU_01145 [Candidatus Limnocylindria bacterium]